MDILGKQTENSGDISEKELKGILIKYGNLSEDEENILDKTLTTTKGNYEIAVSEIYNGSLKAPNDGLFNADTGELIYSWDKLLELGNMINVNNGVLSRSAFTIPNDIAKVKLVITDDGTVTSISGLQYISKLKEVDIPTTVTSISSQAFVNDSDLEIVKIPDNSPISKIDYGTFANCNNLTDIDIPNSVTEIGKNAFSNCSSLARMELSGNVTSIGESAFMGCSSLASVKILNGTTTIGNYAFNGLSNLTSVELSNDTATIGQYAFAGCSNLTNFTMPENINTIGQRAFGGCSAIDSITVPDDVSTVENEAFNEVKQVYYNGSLNTSGWGAQKIN